MSYRSSPARISIRALALSFILLIATPAWGVGPVQAPALPGGATTSDSDPGAGEQWGRFGGRDFSFSIHDPSQFSSLSWGPILSQPPTAAFDDNVDAPGETLSLNLSQSNLAAGIAVWTGTAALTLVNPSGTFNVPTRLTMTVSSSGSAVPLTTSISSPSPAVDVLATGSTFTANVLFEANYNAGWEPILDMFDRLETLPGPPPGTTGPVLTSFSTGFYFETAAAGLSLEEHDENITNQLNGPDGIASRLGNIDGDIEFLKIEIPGRIHNVQSKLNEVHGKVFELSGVPNTLDEIWSRVQSLPTTFPELPSDIASRDDVSQVADNLSQILLILWGLQPCPPEAGPLCDSAKFVQDLASQSSVDEMRTVVDGVSAELSTTASQSSVDTINEILIGLLTELAQLATQSSVDGVTQLLQDLSVNLDNLASQTSVDGLAEVLAGVSDAVQDVATSASVEQIAGELTALSSQLQDVASQSSVDALNEVLIGLLTEIEQTARQATLEAIESDLQALESRLAAIQTAIDSLETPTPIVVEVRDADADSKTRRWIVKTTQHGALVDAAVTRVLAIHTEKTSPAQVVDMTGSASIIPLGPGLIDLTVNTGKDKGVVYQIEVGYNDGSSSVSGSILSTDS